MRTQAQSRRRFAVGVLVMLSLLAGCSIQPVRTVIVNRRGLSETTQIARVPDDAATGHEVRAGDSNSAGPMTQDVEGAGVCRVKYHRSYNRNRWMVVDGIIGNDRKYPVVLDTGASPALFVNDLHIVENKLEIQPSSGDDTNPSRWGLCRMPRLGIGEIALLNWPCLYGQQHTEVQLFGLPLAKGRAIVVGVPALRRFSYIAFDSIEKEVEFSIEEPFECGQPDLWSQYPFAIEEAPGGNAFLFVKIPIAGEQTELQLDTGSGRGLAIAEGLWEQMQHRVQITRLAETKELYPYIGWLDCRQGVIPNLSVGDRVVSRAQISVFPNGSPLLDPPAAGQGLLGMQYFSDSVLVLDFSRSLMWVKNPAGR